MTVQHLIRNISGIVRVDDLDPIHDIERKITTHRSHDSSLLGIIIDELTLIGGPDRQLAVIGKDTAIIVELLKTLEHLANRHRRQLDMHGKSPFLKTKHMFDYRLKQLGEQRFVMFAQHLRSFLKNQTYVRS